MLYDGSLTPMISTPMIGSATEVDGKKVACGKGMKPVLGSKFRVQFEVTASLTWLGVGWVGVGARVRASRRAR